MPAPLSSSSPFSSPSLRSRSPHVASSSTFASSRDFSSPNLNNNPGLGFGHVSTSSSDSNIGGSNMDSQESSSTSTYYPMSGRSSPRIGGVTDKDAGSDASNQFLTPNLNSSAAYNSINSDDPNAFLQDSGVLKSPRVGAGGSQGPTFPTRSRQVSPSPGATAAAFARTRSQNRVVSGSINLNQDSTLPDHFHPRIINEPSSTTYQNSIFQNPIRLPSTILIPKPIIRAVLLGFLFIVFTLVYFKSDRMDLRESGLLTFASGGSGIGSRVRGGSVYVGNKNGGYYSGETRGNGDRDEDVADVQYDTPWPETQPFLPGKGQGRRKRPFAPKLPTSNSEAEQPILHSPTINNDEQLEAASKPKPNPKIIVKPQNGAPAAIDYSDKSKKDNGGGSWASKLKGMGTQGKKLDVPPVRGSGKGRGRGSRR